MNEMRKLMETTSVLFEYLLQPGDSISKIFDLNVFTDMGIGTGNDKEDSLEVFHAVEDDPEFYREWGEYQQIKQQAMELADEIKNQQARTLTDAEVEELESTWYDGADAYDDAWYMKDSLPDIWNAQIEVIKDVLAGKLGEEISETEENGIDTISPKEWGGHFQSESDYDRLSEDAKQWATEVANEIGLLVSGNSEVEDIVRSSNEPLRAAVQETLPLMGAMTEDEVEEFDGSVLYHYLITIYNEGDVPDSYEDDGQPSEYEEYQDYMGGDDWDHGQFDESAKSKVIGSDDWVAELNFYAHDHYDEIGAYPLEFEYNGVVYEPDEYWDYIDFSGANKTPMAKLDRNKEMDRERRQSEESVQEAGMPSSVVKSKQRIANMTDDEKKAYFKGKSADKLKGMARRHGYGKDSDEYSKHASVEEAQNARDSERKDYGKKGVRKAEANKKRRSNDKEGNKFDRDYEATLKRNAFDDRYDSTLEGDGEAYDDDRYGPDLSDEKDGVTNSWEKEGDWSKQMKRQEKKARSKGSLPQKKESVVKETKALMDELSRFKR